jgi:antitoxin ParD1/3/4
MNISITPELEAFVQKKVASGMYNSASELIREALRLLAERDALQQKRMEAMDAFIQAGIDSGEPEDAEDEDIFWQKIDQIILDAEAKNG